MPNARDRRIRRNRGSIVISIGSFSLLFASSSSLSVAVREWSKIGEDDIMRDDGKDGSSGAAECRGNGGEKL